MIDRLVHRTVTLDASLDEVWRLLTDTDEVAGWLGTVDGDTIRELDGTARRFVLDEVVEGERIGFTWWTDGDEGTVSEVVFTVDETADGTRVTVEERAVLAGAGGKVCQWDDRLLSLEMSVLTRSPILV
jgi:uncharacterized protein YndB with AHSA1/START domain